MVIYISCKFIAVKRIFKKNALLSIFIFKVDVVYTNIVDMGNLKKKRRLKMNKHKRSKRSKSNRHKKRLWGN